MLVLVVVVAEDVGEETLVVVFIGQQEQRPGKAAGKIWKGLSTPGADNEQNQFQIRVIVNCD